MEKTPENQSVSNVSFFKSKKGKGIIAAIVVCVVLLASYVAWNAFSSKTTIDMFQSMTLSFEGYDGLGKATIKSKDIKYDNTIEGLSSFVGSCKYEIVDDGKLSNDKKVTVQVKYSEEEAKKLNIAVKSDTAEFEVSGLTKRFASAKDIDKDMYAQGRELITRQLKKYNSKDEYTFVCSYFGKFTGEVGQRTRAKDILIVVYTVPYQSAFTNEITPKYSYAYINFDSEFDKDKDVLIIPKLLTKEGNTISSIETKEEVVDALKRSIPIQNHTFELIEE